MNKSDSLRKALAFFQTNKRFPTAVFTTAVFLVFLLLLGPLDAFHHGYSCDVVSPYDIDTEDYRAFLDLSEGSYSFSFSPVRRHFRGFELYLEYSSSEEKSGTISVTITDASGRILDEVHSDLTDVESYERKILYTDINLRPGTEYTCTLEVREVSSPLYLMIVDGDYLGDETTGDELLIGFIYEESTFSFSEKVLLSTFLISAWCALAGKWLFPVHPRGKRRFYKASAFLALAALLSWNYLFNFLDSENEAFDDFDSASENLVISSITGQERGILASRYGLTVFLNCQGELFGTPDDFVTNEDWFHGYAEVGTQILIDDNEYTRETAAPGNYIEFANGDRYRITGVQEEDPGLAVTLDAGRHLNYYKYGDLSLLRFYDAEGGALPGGILYDYSSQYGLHGKIFRHLAGLLGDDYLEYFHLLCSAAAAIVFTTMVFLLRRKYNSLLARCFYVTFLLSPWIVNFARNLYWVEFTWFLPMLTGLFCSVHIDSRRCRLASYGAAFCSVAVKCLCGYEYISTIMLGLIAFPLADLLVSLAARKDNKERLLRLLKTILLLGMMAVLGFAAALLLHARLAGAGNFADGFDVIRLVILKRTIAGADSLVYADSSLIWESTNASVWETLLTYWDFSVGSSQILTGIPGNLFPLLTLLPPAVLLAEYRRGRLRSEEPVLYILFLCSTLSWLILGKSHSYAHTYLNYVLWYFGFVQICLYILLRPLRDLVCCAQRIKGLEQEG